MRCVADANGNSIAEFRWIQFASILLAQRRVGENIIGITSGTRCSSSNTCVELSTTSKLCVGQWRHRSTQYRPRNQIQTTDQLNIAAVFTPEKIVKVANWIKVSVLKLRESETTGYDRNWPPIARSSCHQPRYYIDWATPLLSHLWTAS
jgi:hypothetical protein